MSKQEWTGRALYLFAMELFNRTGHVTTSKPEFINHSPEQFVYFDNKSDVALSFGQRSLFEEFNNVSFLFSANRCSFYSIGLSTARENRSQVAHEIHSLFHLVVGSDGTICLFQYEDEVMLSFEGFGFRCILSDWYPMEDDYDQLLMRLDIANMKINCESDYFYDMVYSLARYYYLSSQPSTLDILPIDFVSSAGMNGIDREALDKYVESVLTTPQRFYGDDYVDYDESKSSKVSTIGIELDNMLLELDEDTSFGDELESDDNDLEEKNDSGGAERDEYEFSDIDPEIFQDPSLMVKWLNKRPAE